MAFGVSLLFPATPAAAHNSLTGSDPRNGARVATAPARIELRFLAKLDPATTKITVTGPDNVVAGGLPTFTGSRARVPFKPGAAGLYIVGYQVPSSDGHPLKGEVRFTLTTGTPADPTGSPSAAAPAAGSTGGSTTAGATPAGSASVTPNAGVTSVTGAVPVAQERAASGNRWWPWALGVLVLLAAAATGLLVRRRTNRG
ncbi:copper resistance CopC family protein [Micromonospora sp. CPCC 205539]|uniref:copper resistance CopC family protein n=1 Tax=Micromonospora sp. CPCC 205539 TaxID=3122408 RepID=UPI002FF04EDB